MIELLDAETVNERLAKLCGKYCPYTDTTDDICKHCLLGIAKTEVKATPQVKPIQAIHYYWQERDREYGERMDELWKNM